MPFTIEPSCEKIRTNESDLEITNPLNVTHELEKIENLLKEHTEALEQRIFQDLPSKKPDEIFTYSKDPFQVLNRINLTLRRQFQAQEMMLNKAKDLEELLKNHRLLLNEVRMERDVLQERVHTYLAVNCSLKTRLEEQRYETAFFQRQSSPDLTCEIRTPIRHDQSIVESNIQKDKRIVETSNKTIFLQDFEVGNWENYVTEFLGERSRRASAEGTKPVGPMQRIPGAQVATDQKVLTKFFKSPTDIEKQSAKKSKSLTDFTAVNKELHELFERHEAYSNDEEQIKGRNSFGKKSNARSPLNSDPDKLKDLERFTSYDYDKICEKNERISRSFRLKALKNDLANVSEKLIKLKTELVHSVPRQILEEQIPYSKIFSNLKRKSEFFEENALENQTIEFENLKKILEDAKKLNAKLQNLKEEKKKLEKQN